MSDCQRRSDSTIVNHISSRLNGRRQRNNVELHVDVDDMRVLVRLARLGLRRTSRATMEHQAMSYVERHQLEVERRYGGKWWVRWPGEALWHEGRSLSEAVRLMISARGGV